MTETTKPMWKRCDGCKARIFNEAVDIASHRANCPADLKRALQKLAGIVEKLSERLDELEGQVDETAEFLTVDPNAVDEDGFDTLDSDSEPATVTTDVEDSLDDEPATPAPLNAVSYTPGAIA
jgi:predicted nuclease with TOPRIM domain